MAQTANLAMSDLLVSSMNVVSTWALLLFDSDLMTKYNIICLVTGYICGVGCRCSIASICCIAINRYYNSGAEDFTQKYRGKECKECKIKIFTPSVLRLVKVKRLKQKNNFKNYTLIIRYELHSYSIMVAEKSLQLCRTEIIFIISYLQSKIEQESRPKIIMWASTKNWVLLHEKLHENSCESHKNSWRPAHEIRVI